MARELEQVFRTDAMDDAVRAVVVTGAGRAFCAGMDLSAEGNVFGLDESLSPTPEDMRERLEDPEINDGVRDTGGKVTPGDPRAAQAGDRRDQRRSRRASAPR